MKPDLHAMLDSFRTIDEEAGDAAYVRPMIVAFLKLSRQDQIELLAYLVFALMDKWEAEQDADRDARRQIAQAIGMMQAEHEPRQ